MIAAVASEGGVVHPKPFVSNGNRNSQRRGNMYKALFQTHEYIPEFTHNTQKEDAYHFRQVDVVRQTKGERKSILAMKQ